MRPETLRVSVSTQTGCTRDSLCTERGMTMVCRALGVQGTVYSHPMKYTNMGVMEGLKTWKLFWGQ